MLNCVSPNEKKSMEVTASAVKRNGQTASGAMRAAVLVAPERIEVRSMARPAPAPGEVRVRLEGCGVCASNLPLWEGRS